MDELQGRLNPLLRQFGFRRHGRTYNRVTSDGLTQVVGFQMGAFDPPGTTYFPGLRENLYGRFTVNLGVYVPEVAREHGGGPAKAVVHDYNCCVRARLGQVTGRDLWWGISAAGSLLAEMHERLQEEAFPFFRAFESREQIVREFRMDPDSVLSPTPRIVCAIILFFRGDRDEAHHLLMQQVRDAVDHPNHSLYVIGLARRLGLDLTS